MLIGNGMTFLYSSKSISKGFSTIFHFPSRPASILLIFLSKYEDDKQYLYSVFAYNALSISHYQSVTPR